MVEGLEKGGWFFRLVHRGSNCSWGLDRFEEERE